ncbi:hypothetical protein ACEWY4_022306 [Coilia grayii]|uniref:HMG domain-containing protein n=1 Tax=Coilia grayii TaxID=363190 RepID=A0ABD1J937_9TELE
MALANISGKPGVECEHLARVPFAPAYKQPEQLMMEAILAMADKGLISTERQRECAQTNEEARADGACTVYPIFYEQYGFSGRYIFFSIYTGRKESWSVYGRTLVTFDKTMGKWSCQCSSSKKVHRCGHIYLALWWTFQCKNELLVEERETSGSGAEETEHSEGLSKAFTEDQIVAMTNYLWQTKRIPEVLPLQLKQPVPVPDRFEPAELVCPYCPGPTPPDLSDCTAVTTNATVYGLYRVKKGVTVAVRTCPICGKQVRFQEYQTGFHNFNNKILLSIPLCSMLTSAVRNNTAIGRFLSMLEDHLELKIHHNTLRKAFFHFSAITNYSYSYCCNRCGHNPPVLIADGNWKTAFDLPVNLLKRPSCDNIQTAALTVNIDDQWTQLQKQLIAAGFCDGTSSKNPFCRELDYSAFAPWVGEFSRVGPVLPKTEVLKGLSKQLNSTEKSTASFPIEDALFRVLDTKKPQKAELVQACAELGVSAEGSQADILNRLEELVLYKEIYPKMFVKLQKAGGGVLHAGCMHSVVYYCCPLWWQESARDHADALLSLTIPPTVYISDIAGRVARHTNNRTKQQFFQPNDGRLCEATPENIRKAEQKNLHLSFPWVRKLQQLGGPVQSTHGVKAGTRGPHPITGTKDRYSLYDRFHQTNQKRAEEKLRSLDLVPEMTGIINTSMAEQLNKELANSRYFLCQLKDIHFMFMLRLVFHMHNQRINNTFFEKMYRLTKGQASIAANGIVSLFGDGGEMPEDVPSRVSPGHAVSDADIPVFKTVEEKEETTEEHLQTAIPESHVGTPFSVKLFPIQAENEFMALPTYEFICWWRDFHTVGSVSDRNKIILKVLDGHKEQIRVYDSMRLYCHPKDWELDVLRQAFEGTWDLSKWTIHYPQQWLQKDSHNCGVFVCTMAEMEVTEIEARQETLTAHQLQYLRRYHATSIMSTVMLEVTPSFL